MPALPVGNPERADLKAAVLAYLTEHAEPEVPPGPYDAPVFESRLDEATQAYRAHHLYGRPEVTAVTLALLDAASGYLQPDGLDWDGECLTMPGDLRYRPVGLDERGWSVVCRRVGP
jgi:hypothetical protein